MTARRVAAGLVFLYLCAGMVCAQSLSEDFEGYPDGFSLYNVDGWGAWDDLASAAGSVSTTHARSGTKSMLVDPGTDAIHPFFAAECGTWVFTAWMYIETGGLAGGDALFLVQNIYSHGGPYEWAVELTCDSASLFVEDPYRVYSAVPVVFDQWVEIELLIDLTANTCDTSYNGMLLSTGVWNARTPGSPLEIANLDLFSNGGTCWFDDITLTPTGGQDDVQANAVTYMGAAPMPGQTLGLDVEIQNNSAPMFGSVRVDLFVDPTSLPGGDSTAAKTMSGTFTSVSLPAGAGSMAVASFPGLQSMTEDLWRVYATVNSDEAICGDDIANNMAGPTLVPWAAGAMAGLCGDCNQDGVVSILDALTGSQIAAGLFVATAAQLITCDVDQSGAIVVIDALLMAQDAAGLPVVLSCAPTLRQLVEIYSPAPGSSHMGTTLDVSVDLWAEGGSLDAVVFDHSTDGGLTFQPCTDAPGTTLVGGAAASSGADQQWIWDTGVDLPGRPATGVELRVTTTLLGGARTASVTGLDLN